MPRAPGPINIALSESLGELPIVTVNSHADKSPSRSGSPVRRERPKSPNRHQAEENNYRNSLLLSASVSAPSLPLPASSSTSQSKPLPTPGRMPLRSALRNPSRTPSPNPSALPSVAGSSSPSSLAKAVPAATPIQPVPVPAPAPVFAPVITAEPSLRPPSKRRESDISSISSYETGHEVFDDEPPSPADLPPEPLSAPASIAVAAAHPDPQPAPPQPHPQPDSHGSDLSNSTGSTILTAGGTDQPPRRRKSVRMSLPPTFSATPPAIEDTDEDEGHAPWASPGGGSIAPRGWGTRIEASGARDAWQDSSDEDAEYSAARRMLARFSRKDGH